MLEVKDDDTHVGTSKPSASSEAAAAGVKTYWPVILAIIAAVASVAYLLAR